MNVIITGATDMVGKGVLIERLNDPRVGRAMIRVSSQGNEKRILEAKDIVALAYD